MMNHFPVSLFFHCESPHQLISFDRFLNKHADADLQNIMSRKAHRLTLVTSASCGRLASRIGDRLGSS